MSRRYEVLEHTADMAIRVEGSNLQELFTAAAEGLAHLYCPSCDIRPLVEIVYKTSAASRERRGERPRC